MVHKASRPRHEGQSGPECYKRVVGEGVGREKKQSNVRRKQPHGSGCFFLDELKSTFSPGVLPANEHQIELELHKKELQIYHRKKKLEKKRHRE